MTSTMSGTRLPTRSAHSPNNKAPTGRMMSVAVVMNTTSAFRTPKLLAISA